MGLKHFIHKKKPKKKAKRKRDLFYKSQEWKELRYRKLADIKHCECCGKGKGDKLESGERIKLTVDHIKPRSLYPELSLEYDNLQVLCQECNVGKSNKFEDDFRDSVSGRCD